MDSALSSNLQSVSDFWMFFVYCLVVVVVVIFFLFYFNRALGQVLAWILNQYLWRKYHAYIEIGITYIVLFESVYRLASKSFALVATFCNCRVVSGGLIRWPNFIQKCEISQHKSICFRAERPFIFKVLVMGCKKRRRKIR